MNLKQLRYYVNLKLLNRNLSIVLVVLILIFLVPSTLTGCTSKVSSPASDQNKTAASTSLNYDEMVHLDAEELAEGGVESAYISLVPRLKKYVPGPAKVEDVLDKDSGAYSVKYGDKQYHISGSGIDEENSWGLATFAFFSIVNEELSRANTEIRFYAINGGNELGGMFLTEEQATDSRENLANKKDWPYLPTKDAPWFGQSH